MNQRRIALFFSVFFLLQMHSNYAQKRTLNIKRTKTAPKIDGLLDDDAWKNQSIATGFTQFRPDMGKKDSLEIQTIVKMTYDDNAIYVSAFLKDDPSKIMKQFRSRDNFGQADFFAIILNPNNDAQNDFEFFVFSSGNQADALATPTNGEDFSWNAVWESRVKIVDDGWIVEVKIPYRTLRFSNNKVQTWGVQFHRRFQRDNSQYSWNPIDVTKGSISLYHGQVTGIENIKPPVRLVLYPFTTYVYDNNSDGSSDLKLGMDVKYGISESFTLDATLIPDFSQVGFDNVSLNLGPFEQVFNEQRQFFTEGVELFSKGNLFFSRRIGGRPSRSVNLGENEELINNPNTVKLLNSVKVSGRDKKGLGIGFLNSITERTEATIKTNDPNGEAFRQEVVEPFTNYNVFVVDKQFNQNSSVSIINTNVLREGNFRDANVTAIVADINNKKNSFNLEAQAKYSYVNEGQSAKKGFNSYFAARKTNGKFRIGVDHSYADENYDINDLGLLFRNNFNNTGLDLSYQIFKPTERLNRYQFFGWANYERLASPDVYTGFSFGTAYFATTKKLLFYGGNIGFAPGKQYDYFEPRTAGRFYTFENRFFTNFQIATNRNKKFSFEVIPEYIRFFGKERKSETFGVVFIPSYRPTTKLSLLFRTILRNTSDDQGYANVPSDEIVFGDRDRFLLSNTLSATYNFNELHFLNLNFRHNWETVSYNQLYVLENDGSLRIDPNIRLPLLSTSPNINFSTWNFDLNYSWQFAPGSFLTVLYRNQAFNQTANSSASFTESVNTLFANGLNHIFSVRLQYFFDINTVLRKKG